jgi:Methylamine utilisation protein MauE
MDVAARVALGAILLAAVAAKLRAHADLADVLAGYGIPAPARRPLAVALIVVEAALWVGLVAGVAVRPAAYGALALAALFIAVLARVRIRGITSLRCGCFGAKERSTSLLLMRAAAFAALAALTVLAVEREPRTPSREIIVLVVLTVLSIVVIALAVLLLALYRQVGVLTLRIAPRAALELAEEGPPVGEPAPALGELVRRGPELVAFFSENCRLCRELAPAVRALAREGVRVHVLYELAQPDAFAGWRVPGAPFFVHVIDGAVVAKGLVNTLEQLDHLLALGRARRSHAAA